MFMDAAHSDHNTLPDSLRVVVYNHERPEPPVDARNQLSLLADAGGRKGVGSTETATLIARAGQVRVRTGI